MIRFLFKGLLRDKSRSRMPVIVVAIGVMLTVWLHAYINGFMGDTIEMNAKFSNGHVKVMTRAYADNMSQVPIDLALINVTALMSSLQTQFPDVEQKIKIIAYTEEIPNEPWVIRSNLLENPSKNRELKETIIAAVLEFAKTKEGKEMLANLMHF